MTTETAQSFDVVAFANGQNEELRELQRQVRIAQQAVEDKKKVYEAELRAKLVGRYVKASGRYQAESRMLQDGMTLEHSTSSFKDRTFIVTHVFLINEAYPFQSEHLTPIVYATHKEAFEKNLRGGDVSFRLLSTSKFELVDA